MQLSRLIEAVNSLIIRSCGGKAHKRITNNLKFIGQTYTIKEPDVNRNYRGQNLFFRVLSLFVL